MTTPEGRVKQKVRKVLNELGAYYSMTVTGGFGNSGTPDYIVCFGGRFYGIECKAQDNKPTALQLKHLKDIKRNGGVALIIDEHNVEQLENMIIHAKET